MNRQKRFVEKGRGRRLGPWGVAALMVCLWAAPSPMAAQTQLDSVARLAVEAVSVEQALQSLGRSAGVSLVYSPDLLPRERRVTCACERVTVREALQRILDGTGLAFRVSGAHIRIVPVVPGSDGDAPGAVAGVVLADDGRTPVVGAAVRMEDGRSVFSRGDGSFVLDGVPVGTYRLRASSLGWAEGALGEVAVRAHDTTVVSFLLAPAAIPLPEILVSPGTFRLLEDVPPGGPRSLTRDEIQTLPQVGEDIFRSMKRLPGVASSDISTKLTVRGGASREVMVRLDGLELHEPYHMKDWDGAVGIVDVNALGGVELAAGGFGVEHGDKMAGVLDMRSRTEAGEAKTTLGMSVTNVTAMSRGGFGGGKGSWLASARRGFMGLVIKLIGEDDRLSPQYYDVFGKVSWAPNARNVVTAHALHAGDRFGLHVSEVNDLDRIDFESGWDSSYGWLTWEASPHPRVTASTMGWLGRVTRRRDGVVADFGRPDMPDSISVQDDRVFTVAGLRHDLEFKVSDAAMLKAGVDVRDLRADYTYRALTVTQAVTADGRPSARHDEVDLSPTHDGTQLGAYMATRVRPVQPLSLEVGLRYDRVSHAGDRSLTPRVLGALELGPRTTLRGSWGRYFQSHGIQELEVADGEIVYHGAERSDQVALGIEHRFAPGVDARVELYHRSVADQRPRFINLEQDLRIFPEVEGDRLAVDPARGRTRGLEVTLERRSGARWAWAATYALALAEDEIPGLLGRSCAESDPCSDRLWLPRPHDQRHTVGVQVTHRPARGWDLSWAWAYHSGWPATSWSYDAVDISGGRIFLVRNFGPVRDTRLPAYHRLDMRVTRDFTVRDKTLRVFLDLFNLYDRTNLASYRYDYEVREGRVATVRRNGLELLPLLPTIGLRYEF